MLFEMSHPGLCSFDRIEGAKAAVDGLVIGEKAHDILAWTPRASALFADECNHPAVWNHLTLTKAFIGVITREHVEC